MPVPSTRSSSEMPVFCVRVAEAVILVIGCAGLDGVRPCGALVVAAAGLTGVDSWNVPHDPHSGQRPSHFGET